MHEIIQVHTFSKQLPLRKCCIEPVFVPPLKTRRRERACLLAQHFGGQQQETPSLKSDLTLWFNMLCELEVLSHFSQCKTQKDFFESLAISFKPLRTVVLQKKIKINFKKFKK